MSAQGKAMLSTLLNGIMDVSAEKDCEISSMTLDSREVNDGALFVALGGTQQHGLNYADVARQQGAAAIIWESDNSVTSEERGIQQIEVPHLREHLGLIADRFYGSPSQSLNVIGITGTDGKTSVSHFLAQAIKQSAVIGTLGIGPLDNLQKATHTTPDVINVHKNLAAMKAQHVSTVAMEVSSHALDQGRVANVAFDIAVLTNLSRDHLDYHKTVEAYGEAKEKLFTWPDLKALVINLDDAFGRKMAQKWGGVIGYGIGEVKDYPEGSLVAEGAIFTSNGIAAKIFYGTESGQLNAAVLGRFNLSNLLAALGAMLALDFSLTDALAQLNKVHTVAGRMEKVSDADILAVIDYAHTPNALEAVLKALREHTQSKLICVFGCGGDRDAGKRPLMAQIAEKYADVVIVTDDNPRTENPEKIMQDIISGFTDPQKANIQHDRSTAIHQALTQAKKGDTVLIAGKGHENIQILATGSIPFSDREQANKVLQGMAA